MRRSSVTGEVQVVDVVTFKYDIPSGENGKAVITLAAPAGGGERETGRAERTEGCRPGTEVLGSIFEKGGEGEAGSRESSPRGGGEEYFECVDELYEHPEEIVTEA